MTSNIYTIRLNYKPFCDTKGLKNKHKETLMKKHKRILEIIENSLFGFDVLSHAMSHGNFSAVICPNGDVEFGTESVQEYLKANYGDSATDTWMEGDISLGFLKYNGELADEKHLFDADLHTVELEITLQSVENGAQRLESVN